MKWQREPSRASGQRPCSYQSQGTPSGGAPEGARPLFQPKPGAGPAAQEPSLQTSRPAALAGGGRARRGGSGLAAEGAAPP